MPNLGERRSQDCAAAPAGEDPAYLRDQLITCIGNKRALLGPIRDAVDTVRERLGRERLRCLDLFSGSGVVSRLLKSVSSHLWSNDLELYAALIGRCYLANRSRVDLARISNIVEKLNEGVASASAPPGFLEELYAPRDESAITESDRVFYTKANARRLDTYRRLIDEEPLELRPFLLGPLLSEASIHANTAGVFKGFYKDRATGRGRFGGSHGDALSRIRGPVVLRAPVLSRFEYAWEVFREDANRLVERLEPVDLAYIDPPYNQHPYGSNYFMLNLVAEYRRPRRISRVSGIPADWTRSGYNARRRARELLADLVGRTRARYLLVSYNNEGFLPPGELRDLLAQVGRVEVWQTRYATFRGSRNLRQRSPHVTEQLFLVEKRKHG
jgi:adenine-specific DNA-methyltransferase